ncbi:class C sortase [Allobaculum sp. JKK-2023]|uniref:class C sortase n=1 Tax=Allobaculum sp. JKK-2023 TaxID=3108943 RepID=UPI002B056053|nr:class C sortase [Allobaculum sp. JKK-2023]
MTGIKRTIQTIMLAGGLGLCLAPTIWSCFSSHVAADQIQSYHEQTKQIDQSQLNALWNQAERWNELLAGHLPENQIGILELANTGEQAFEQAINDEVLPYDQQLCVLDHGVMGILHIPRIDVTLPIYHGVEEEALSKGAGHLPSSSLPIGSSNSRCVLSAHRGLMSSELFTRLDEMEKGDLFQIENPRQTMAYEVESIDVILPEEVEKLAIVEGQDLVTLVTCTPYGINDHRLLVTGHRVEWNEQVEQKISEPVSTRPSLREQIFRTWPWMMAVLVALVLFISWRSSRRKELK